MPENIVYTGTPKEYFPKFTFQEKELVANGFIPNPEYRLSIERKAQSFTAEKRAVLVSVLNDQYSNIGVSKAKGSIKLLSSENTFTVTTGQQIHIFLGPMYVHNKILSAIELAKKLKEQFPKNTFIPIFWMATEDHDMEEIDHINLFGENVPWKHEHGGISGDCPTKGLVDLMDALVQGRNGINKEYQRLFKQAYENFSTLADATRFLIDQLYGDQGVLVIDGNDKRFKELFKPSMIKDILNQGFNKLIDDQSDLIKKYGVKSIISSRKTNFFYITKNGIRDRLDFKNQNYTTQNTLMNWSIASIKEEIEKHPERFSPNVSLRPLYQETILPNIAYLAGPSEYVYWMQIQKIFEEVPAPILKLRKTYIYILEKDWMKVSRYAGLESALFSEDGLFLEELTSIISGENPIEVIWEEQHSKLLDDIEKLNTLNIPNLKALSSISNNYLDDLKMASKEFGKNRMNNPEIQSKIAAVMKIKKRYFDHKNKWERKTYLFEQLLFKNSKDIANTTYGGDDLIHITCG